MQICMNCQYLDLQICTTGDKNLIELASECFKKFGENFNDLPKMTTTKSHKNG